MVITDARYAAVLVTEKGRSYPTDSVECLAALLESGTIPRAMVRSLWVTDFGNPGNLVDATTAQYLVAPTLPSPMGLNLTAFAEAGTAQSVAADHSGGILSWVGVQSLVRRQWRIHAPEMLSSL